jgi:two-component system, sensor histidine kinase
VGVMWDNVVHVVLLAWLAVMCAHQAVRIYHFLGYRSATRAEQSDPRWGRYYALAATTAGCIWGSAGVVMFVPQPVEQVTLFLLLSGVVTVSMISLSAYAPAFFSLAPLTLLPFIARALWDSNSSHAYFALVGLLVLGMALVFGRNMNKVFTESLSKRFENLDLIAQLQAQTVELAEQKQAADQARLEAERASSAKSQFFRAANHDLRQPLHALGMFGRALSERIRFPEVRGIVDGMNASIRALEALFNALLDISKLDAGAIEPTIRSFALRDLLAQVYRDFKPEADAKGLELQILASNVAVESDAILLERVLRNLVSNAIRNTTKGKVAVHSRVRGRGVRIRVFDTGRGIPKAERDRIFEEFYQVGNPDRHSKKGLGLGLATVKRITNLLDYKLRLTSRPGRGSVFSVDVPLGREELAPVESAPRVEVPTTGFAGKAIVVVDDEEVILTAMKAMLKGWNCEVLARSSTSDVLEGLGELSRYPDLIIADYRLQGGETGIQAIQRIRSELGQPVPAIVVTGSVTEEPVIEAEAGGYLLLHKPVLPEDLERLMNVALQARQ